MKNLRSEIEKVKLTDIGYEGAIINAIREAQKANQRIIKLGLPVRVQKELNQMIDGRDNHRAIKEVFGIPVEEADTMQITVEFSRFLSSENS